MKSGATMKMKVFISWSGPRSQVGTELEVTKFGISCLTRDNLLEPWILFEAGALAKSTKTSRVVPLLLDLELQDVQYPLGQFQAKKVGKEGLLDIVKSINQTAIDEGVQEALPPERLNRQFTTLWPDFDSRLKAIPQNTTEKKSRDQREILEELVSSVRGLETLIRSWVGRSGVTAGNVGLYVDTSVNPVDPEKPRR
jgi:hypothetical protein